MVSTDSFDLHWTVSRKVWILNRNCRTKRLNWLSTRIIECNLREFHFFIVIIVFHGSIYHTFVFSRIVCLFAWVDVLRIHSVYLRFDIWISTQLAVLESLLLFDPWDFILVSFFYFHPFFSSWHDKLWRVISDSIFKTFQHFDLNCRFESQVQCLFSE